MHNTKIEQQRGDTLYKCFVIDNLKKRRMDSSENFYRNWSEYKNSFGNLQRELWLGWQLENLHASRGNGMINSFDQKTIEWSNKLL